MGRWAIINGVLVVFVLLVGWQIARIWGRTLPPVDVVARQAGGAQPTPKSEGGGKGKRGEKAATKAAETAPPVMVAAIVERDLFDPSRTKPSEDPKVVPTAPVVAPPQNVTISGVSLVGKDREAFITDNGQTRRVRVGDQVQGYIVKTIRTTELVMASPAGEPVSMSLAVEKGKGALPTGRPPVPPKPGQPPQPGPLPTGPVPSAAGVQPGASPAAGIQPPKPPPLRPGIPPPPGAPGAPGVPPVHPIQPVPVPAAGPPGGNPNVQIPNQVRDSLERFKEQQRERREMGNK